jgi:hypothetical protein
MRNCTSKSRVSMNLYLKELLDLDVVGDDFPESDAFVLGEDGGDVVVVGGGERRGRVQNSDLPPMFQNFFFRHRRRGGNKLGRLYPRLF